MDRAEALAKLHEWVKSPNLLRHIYTVEHVMSRAAPRYGGPDADAAQWAIAGLLHDADYEMFPDEHPQRVIAWLRERGEEAIAYAIACHSLRWGVEPKSALDKSLLACDELTGFIVACCWLRPDGIQTLEPASVLKKLKDKKFAAGVDRTEVAEGAKLLGVDLADHAGFIIGALRERAAEFGLTGRGDGAAATSVE
jgi:predicted hydrolase (HD superfamily)